MATLFHVFRAPPGRLFLILLMALLQTQPVYAQHHERGGHAAAVRSGPVSHGAVRHFNTNGRGVANGGRFFHGRHGGRDGWWWIAGPSWYYYSTPVYPNPDPYWYPEDGPYSGGVWYYCPSVGGYYPYVSDCPGGWIIVNAGP